MKYGSVCSGIEAATVAWEPLGWHPQWFSDIDPFASAVLAHHWPTVTNLGDFTTIGVEHGPIDLLVGGTPCQSFSIAGLRTGLDDERGNLALEFCKLLDRLRPSWLVWENVPGVLSSNGGRDFGSILGAMDELGYGWAYRFLDSQYFGVPQRRRRVFLVGYLGDWRPAAAVLFERYSLSGHSAPSRKTRQAVTSNLSPGVANTCKQNVALSFQERGRKHGRHLDSIPDCAYALTAPNGGSRSQERLVCVPVNAIAFDWRAGDDSKWHTGPNGRHPGGGAKPIHRAGDYTGALTASRQDAVAYEIPDQTTPEPDMNISPLHVAYDPPGICAASSSGTGWWADTQEVIGSITAHEAKEPHHLISRHSDPVNMAVRRLTPRECERLMGFPDDHTLVHYRGAFAADSPRYRAIGNSIVVPVLRWIGVRIETVQSLLKGDL